MPWPIDHYLLKLKAGQKVEMTLSGVVKHGSVRVGVMKRSGYYVNPIKTGQFTESQHLRLKDGSDRHQTLVYEIKEDGYYNIIISTVGKLNKNYTVKSDMLYDVRWRLI